MLSTLLAIGLGGGLGAISRYLISMGLNPSLGQGFPIATLAINLLGSCLIGVLAGISSKQGLTWISPFLMIGFLGAFTTFSSFSLESISLISNGQHKSAIAYILLSNCLGIGLAYVGFSLTK